MKAQFTKTDVSNARNMGDKKETIKQMVLITHKDGEFKAPVVVRWYISRSGVGASLVYCSLWINHHPYYVSGRGKAGGYGYDKASAAFQEACGSAGIKLDKDVSGVGDGAVREAILAIGEALGFDVSEMHICEG